MSGHAECACECCGLTRQLITTDTYLPQLAQSAAAFLNTERDLTSQGPISPRSLSGEGFVPVASPQYVSGGTVQFLDFEYQVLTVTAWCDPLLGASAGIEAINPSVTPKRYSTPPEIEQGSVSIDVGPITAAAEYNIALIPAYNPQTPTEDRDRVTIPIPGQTPDQFVGLRKEGASNEGYGFVVVCRLGAESFLAVNTTAYLVVGINQDRVPPALEPSVWAVANGDSFVYTLSVSTLLLNSPGGVPDLIVPILLDGWRAPLDGRVVVERNGDVVADRLRPSDAQYATDTQADGEYVTTIFYGSDYDAAWEGPGRDERRLGASPYMAIRTLAVDSSRPVIGVLPLDDIYADESPQGPFVISATKPLASSALFRVLEDDSQTKFATRPVYSTRSLWSLADGANVGLFLGVGTYTIRPGGSIAESSNDYRDVNDRRPLALPSLPYQIHSVPHRKGPRPAFRHPGLDTREQFRPRTQQEAVSHVDLVFSEPVAVAAIRPERFLLLVDGSTVGGLSVAPVGDSGTVFRVQVPTQAQTEGAFVVLSFVPDQTVISTDGTNTPAQLTCRTGWLMQKPYFRITRSFPTSRVRIGDVATLTATSDAPPERSPTLAFSSGTSWTPNNAQFSLRERGDGFVPTLPVGDNPPENCSYFGLTSTIHPCPPRILSCPVPVAAQPHASTMLYGGGSNNLSLQVVFSDRSTGEDATLTDSDETIIPGVVSNLSRLKLLSLHGLMDLGTTLLGENLPQNFWTRESDASAQFVNTVDLGVFGRTTTRSLKKIHAWIRATRGVQQWDHLETAYPDELFLEITVRMVIREHVTYFESQGGPNAVPEDELPTVRSWVVRDGIGVSEAQEQAGTFYISCGITTGLPGNKMPFWKITL